MSASGKSVIVMCRSSLVCSGDRQVVASDPQRGVGLDQTPLRVLATTRRCCTSPTLDADGRATQLHYAGSQPPGRSGVQVPPDAVAGQAVVALRDGLDDSQVSMSYVDEIAVARGRLLGTGPMPAE